MFDLFRSRQKAVRYLLGGLLLMVASSMVITLIPGYGSSTARSSTDDQTLADIGKDKITADQVKLMAQRIFRSGQVPPDMVDVYIPQIVEEMIQQRAVLYEFEREGLTVSDDEILAGLASENQTFFKDGALISKDQFEQALAQQGMTLQDAIDDMRRKLMMKKIGNVVYAGVIVTEKEIDDFYTKQKEKAKIQYIGFPAAKFRGDVKVTDADLHGVFEANRGAYVTPEKRTFQVLILEQSKVEESMTISEADLRAAYSGSMDNFRMPERVKVRHVLVDTRNKSDAEKKQLLVKAQNLLKQLKGGADFAEVAKANSDDTSNAKTGGDLGWVVHGQMVPEFDKAAFTLKPKDISDIVTTQFGYHILQVMEKEPAHVKPFDEVKTDLATQLKKERVTEMMQSTADKVRAALQKSPGSAAEIAKQYNVNLVSVTKSAAGSAIPSLGVTPEIDNALGPLKPNEVTQVISLPANRLVVAVLNAKEPPRQSNFDEVEGQVREKVTSEKATVIAEARAKEAADKLKAGADIDRWPKK
jgi:peptidyl-prolyl cis-trans isomerase D